MPCPALAAPCPRDSVNGNDELVFYARDPRYWVPEDRSGSPLPAGNAWRVISLTSTTLTVAPKPGDKFEKGRIIQLVCKDGATYLYVTVARNVPKIGPSAPVSQPIVLVPSVASNPFKRQDLTTLGDCFNSGNARAFFIDRFRFHVRPVQVGKDYRPYLMLDRGLDENNDGADEAEEIIVAEGIESFQVGYVLTATSKDWPARGTVAGVPITFAAGAPGSKTGNAMTTLQFPGLVNPGQWTYQPTSFYRYAVGPTPAIADERVTDHQANIRGVRLVIVARGPEPDPAQARSEVLLPILNQNALPTWAVTQSPYSRARVETTVPVRNMTTRAMNDF
jgi:type IV pilus assembly protein PilW